MGTNVDCQWIDEIQLNNTGLILAVKGSINNQEADNSDI